MMVSMKRFLTLVMMLWSVGAMAQRPSFVDGYHGGIYGHYPLEWKTRFLCETFERNPTWRMSLEIEPETWDSVARHTPADYERFRKIAASPRIEFTNPAYAQPYCYNISGESIIRQFQYGISKINDHFPEVEFMTYAVEEPCFTSSLPQILKQLGYKYATLKCPNTCWGGYAAAYGGELVNWIAPDGSSLLTSPRYECEELYPKSVWQTTAWGNEEEYLTACREAGIEHPIGMTLQDAGWRGGPWIGREGRTRGNSCYVTWREYFETIANNSTNDDYHFSQEDVRPGLMWGSQVLQRIAQLVRQGENEILQSEQIASMAYLEKGVQPNQQLLDEGWRTLMLSEHHDSWIVPYNRLNERGSWADNIEDWVAKTKLLANGEKQVALNSLAASPRAISDEVCYRVYNTQPFARHEVVSITLPQQWQGYNVIATDPKGRPMESAIADKEIKIWTTLPAFGYSSISLKRGKTTTPTYNEDSQTTISNDLYRIEVDSKRGGVIKHLYVREGKSWRDYTDHASEYGLTELHGYFYHQGQWRSSMEQPAKVRRIQLSEIEQCLEIKGHIASHPFTQRITLRKGSPLIDIELEIDWLHNDGIGEFAQRDSFSENRRACYDDRYKLSLMLPVALNDPALYKNAPYDVCRSQLESTHYGEWRDIKHNVILNWIDLVERGNNPRGLALLSDHTTSYRHGKDEPLGLTIQYSGSGLWGRDYPVKGKTHIKCALIAHRHTWYKAGIERENAKWNAPLIVSACSPSEITEHSFLDLGQSGYILSAAYPTPEGWVVRLYNAEGSANSTKLSLGIEAESISEIDLRGNEIKSYDLRQTSDGCEIKITTPRFGFKTLRIKTK